MMHWMKQLALQYDRARTTHPEKNIMIMFDIDGTILDNRAVIHYALKAYDRSHQTQFFKDLSWEEIDCHEDDPRPLLQRKGVPESAWSDIQAWFQHNRWNQPYLLEAHRPFQGVLEVIRWFMIQPRTFVGLNTARPESRREDTLKSLNALGKEFRVRFDSKFLFMSPGGWGKEVLDAKVAGIRHFENQGYHVVAFIDNEPENLRAVAEAHWDHPILLLHAETIFQTPRHAIPPQSVGGKAYDLAPLMQEKDLPQHIEFVWQGLEDTLNFSQFLNSKIHWAELSVRQDPVTEQLIVRSEGLVEKPVVPGEELLPLEPMVKCLSSLGRGLKFHIRENGTVSKHLEELIDRLKVPHTSLWFYGSMPTLRGDAFKRLAKKYPESVRQCPISFLSPMILGAPEEARRSLKLFQGWGINRFGMDWLTPERGEVLSQLHRWNCPVDIENIFDLESFLRAVLFLPQSITSDFNLPQWGYFIENNPPPRKFGKDLFAAMTLH